MKRLLVIALMAVVFTASAQDTKLFFIDTISDGTGTFYTNNYEDVMAYHESDWLIYDSKANDDGQSVIIFLNDTDVKSTVYVYYMVDGWCYHAVISQDPNSVDCAEHMLKMILDDESVLHASK